MPSEILRDDERKSVIQILKEITGISWEFSYAEIPPFISEKISKQPSFCFRLFCCCCRSKTQKVSEMIDTLCNKKIFSAFGESHKDGYIQYRFNIKPEKIGELLNFSEKLKPPLSPTPETPLIQ